jgi:hypothetical protein
VARLQCSGRGRCSGQGEGFFHRHASAKEEIQEFVIEFVEGQAFTFSIRIA